MWKLTDFSISSAQPAPATIRPKITFNGLFIQQYSLLLFLNHFTFTYLVLCLAKVYLIVGFGLFASLMLMLGLLWRRLKKNGGKTLLALENKAIGSPLALIKTVYFSTIGPNPTYKNNITKFCSNSPELCKQCDSKIRFDVSAQQERTPICLFRKDLQAVYWTTVGVTSRQIQ